MRFKTKDIVYHWSFGKGEIVKMFETMLTVNFDNEEDPVTLPHKTAEETLSFKPYDLTNGGFSTERDLPDIKEGQLIYVKSNLDIWELRFFHSFDTAGRAVTFSNQKPEGKTVTWQEYSLTNPLISE